MDNKPNFIGPTWWEVGYKYIAGCSTGGESHVSLAWLCVKSRSGRKQCARAAHFARRCQTRSEHRFDPPKRIECVSPFEPPNAGARWCSTTKEERPTYRKHHLWYLGVLETRGSHKVYFAFIISAIDLLVDLYLAFLYRSCIAVRGECSA